MFFSNLNHNLTYSRKFKKIKKDKINRFLFLKYERKKKIYKFLLKQSNIPTYIKIFPLNFYLFLLKKKSSNSSINNFCIMTGRSRGVKRIFKISRIRLREWSLSGWLPNVRNSSW